jgi:hypothetical protein
MNRPFLQFQIGTSKIRVDAVTGMFRMFEKIAPPGAPLRRMSMKRVAALSMLVVLVAVASAYSTSAPSRQTYNITGAESYNAHFGNMDPNKDGQVNWQEFKAFFPKSDEKTFSSIDLNKDGFIDHDEWHAFKAAYDLKHKD